MPLHPWPHIMRAGGLRLTVANCGVGIPGEPYSPGFAAPGMALPGGALEPAEVNGVAILGLKQGAPGTTFFIALAGGGLPQDTFAQAIIPGVNGGAPLLTSAATVQTSVYESTTFTWWLWSGLTDAPPVDGEAYFS